MNVSGKPSTVGQPPSLREALRFWLKLGFISFGGPTGQIAIMHAELVEKKRWISNARFLHALNYCMLLPGPEAQQLATYCGWLLHRTWGGIVAGTLFVLPAVFVLWGLSYVYVTWGAVPSVDAFFDGLKPAVMAIVVAATLRIGRKALKNEVMWGLAALAFVAIFFFKAPFPLIIVAAAAIGWFGSRSWPHKFQGGGGHGETQDDGASSVIDDTHDAPVHARPSWARAGRVLGVALVLWWTPVLLAGWWQGWNGTLFREGVFFSKAAMVTFGGAYAVLPYVAQEAVEQHGWLSHPQMMDGLAFAETTPGPLIMVVQHVGFMGGWHHPAALDPLVAATLGALLTTWVTFVPCFLWIFLGAPHIEQLRGQARFNAALSTVTAAVVGVILNLAVWFGWAVIRPETGGTNWFAVVLGGLAFVGLHHFKAGLITVILASGALGLTWHLVKIAG